MKDNRIYSWNSIVCDHKYQEIEDEIVGGIMCRVTVPEGWWSEVYSVSTEPYVKYES